MINVTDVAGIIKHCHLAENANNERYYAKQRKRLYRGSHYSFSRFGQSWDFFDSMLNADIYDEARHHEPGWQYVEAWIDSGYRVVWISSDQLAVFTYCEGDLTLAVLADQEAYEAELADAAKCYGKTLSGEVYQVS